MIQKYQKEEQNVVCAYQQHTCVSSSSLIFEILEWPRTVEQRQEIGIFLTSLQFAATSSKINISWILCCIWTHYLSFQESNSFWSFLWSVLWGILCRHQRHPDQRTFPWSSDTSASTIGPGSAVHLLLLKYEIMLIFPPIYAFLFSSAGAYCVNSGACQGGSSLKCLRTQEP